MMPIRYPSSAWSDWLRQIFEYERVHGKTLDMTFGGRMAWDGNPIEVFADVFRKINRPRRRRPTLVITQDMMGVMSPQRMMFSQRLLPSWYW